MNTAGSCTPRSFQEKNDDRDGISGGAVQGDFARHPGEPHFQKVRQQMELAILIFAALVFTTRTEDQQ